MEQFLFTLFATLACGGAIAVVLTQNVVRMAFYLVIALASTAGLFFLLNADFVGATQLLIYVGGTIVLLIFGVMLTSSSPYSSIKNTPAEILQGGLVGMALLAVLFSTVISVDWGNVSKTLQYSSSAGSVGYNDPQEGNTARPIGTALLGMRFDRHQLPVAVVSDGTNSVPARTDEVNSGAAGPLAVEDIEADEVAGGTLGTGYLLPFEIISMHLLVVLIGASYLARAKRAQVSVDRA